MFTNMGLNLVFVVPMVIYGVTGPHAGLALATGLAAWLNASLLWRGLRRQEIYRPQPGWQRLSMQVMVALLAMLAVLWLGVAEGSQWSGWDWHTRAVQLMLWIAAAGTSYVLMLWLVGLRPASIRRVT
jgi:putative peptidoglycan lipid II flippase